MIDILRTTGYDSALAVKQFNTEKIDELESYLSNLNYQFENTYYSPFKRFLPGHRSSLLKLDELLSEYELQKKILDDAQNLEINDPHFSFIMKELIKSAKNNGGKDFRQRRFPESLQHFGMFLYMMCGKASYEIICNNIPLPQSSTMCKLISVFVLLKNGIIYNFKLLLFSALYQQD